MVVVLITLVSCFCLDEVAPWFAVSGNLTLACWDKLGKDLDRAWEEGSLQDRAGKTGVQGLWKVIRSCLTCESCLPAIQATAEALEQVKEARSDTHSAKSQEPPSQPPHLYPSLKGIEGSRIKVQMAALRVS